MATVVLSAVGAVIGGPIGAAVGAVIGQQVDSVIFAPGRRQGPRLGDLSVQTSSYGSPIPKLFGSVRVSGTVIWATDLKESRTTRSNGKGRGSTDVYSYSASFAVALSGRRITGIGRIWADGKLLRGAAGDFKSETGFRWYAGAEGQALDPLIAANEGIGSTPAYRGIAYAVFEDMQLADFGNRIPSISFEVIADAGGSSAGAVLSGVGAIASDGGPPLAGVAVTGDSVRGVAETLAQAMPFSVVSGEGGLTARFGAGPARTVAADDRGATSGGSVPAIVTERAAAASVPDLVTIAYNDVDRDYLVGSQRARRDGTARREVRVDLPAAIGPGTAKAIGQARLARFWTERSRATVTLPWRAMNILPGDRCTVPGLAGRWRVSRLSFEAMVLRLDLVLESPASLITAVAADGGRNVSQTDIAHGPTVLRVIDVPQIGETPVSAPILAVAANGPSGGWRRASLMASVDGGATYRDAGGTALPATLGTTLTALPRGSAYLIDRAASVDVQLVHAGLTLQDADEDALLAGANLAMIDDELVQFGRADPLGAGQWRLRELWRGRWGTEWATDGHAANGNFALMEPQTLRPLDSAFAVALAQVLATGLGDASGAGATAPAEVGTAVRPLAPVALRAAASGNDIAVSWLRRSRDGWRWRDGVDVPIGEESERYRLTKVAGGRPDLVVELASPAWIYAASERTADAAAGAASVVISVLQVGAVAVSRPAAIVVSTS